MISDTDLPQQPNTFQQQLSLSSKSRKLLALITAVLLSALVAGAGGYVLGSRNMQPIPISQPSPSPQPTRTSQSAEGALFQPSPTFFIPKTSYPVPTTNHVLTADWKTYKSKKYSLTFRYPPYIYANTLPAPTTMHDWYSDDVIFSTKPGLFLQRGATPGHLYVFFRDKDFEEDSDKVLGSLKGGWMDYKYEGIIVGGRTGRIISGYTTHYTALGSKKKEHIREIAIPLKDKNYLHITYIEKAINLDEFNQMLSTFKFTDQ